MTDPFSKQKAALVTGSAKRVGQAMVIDLAKQGYAIALHYHSSQAEALETQKAIERHNGLCLTFKADLQDEGDISKLAADVFQKFPGLNLLINSASLYQPSCFPAKSTQSFKANLAVHLHAPYLLSSLFAQKCKKDGLIINMIDTHVAKNKSPYFDYLLSKKALLSFTEMAAVELAPKIRVNAIAPGFIMPPAQRDTRYLNQLARSLPLKRKGDVGNVLKAIQYLISNDYVTGQVLFVDGGEHLVI
jgi:NAD(P)-dependent dehydrogenase (short-subunit alcohol dehydrogenase family)